MRVRLAGIAASILAHGAMVALLVIGLPWPNPTGAVDHGLQGIEISLAAGGIPSMQQPPPPAPEPEPPQKAEESPVEPPPPQVMPQPEPTPVIASRSEAPAAEEVPRPDPKPKPQRRPPRKPEAVKKPVEPPATPAPGPAQQSTEFAAAPVSPGTAGERVAPGAGTGPSVSSGGNPGLEADYYAQLLAWLEKHKEYPRGAQLRRHQGVAHLRFSIDSTGRVLTYKLERSSGYETLDDAVERMIRNAGQLPPIPAALGKERLDLVVPVQFFLRQR